MKKIFFFLAILIVSLVKADAQALSMEADTISAGGHTFTLVQFGWPPLPARVYFAPANGAVTLTGNIAYNVSPAPIQGTLITFEWPAGFTLNSNTIQVAGISLTQQQLNQAGYISVCYYDNGGDYTSHYVAGTGTSGGIIPANISLPSADILVGNSSGYAAAVSVGGVLTSDNTGAFSYVDSSVAGIDIFHSVPGNLAVFNGSRILAGVTMSGDATIVASGALTIGAGAVTLSKMANGGTPYNLISYNGSGNVASQSISSIMSNACVGCVSASNLNFTTCNCSVAQITLDSAQISTANSSPVIIIPAVNGRTIKVITWSLNYTYSTAAFASNTTVELLTNTAGTYQASYPSFLALTSTGQYCGGGPIAGQSLVQSQPLQFTVATGNPTAGSNNSSLTITVWYYLL